MFFQGSLRERKFRPPAARRAPPLFSFVVHNDFFVSVVFRLVLIVSLWQGPIVWGHCHQHSAVGLASHLAKFHSDVSDPWTLGWHWHCTFPNDAFPVSSDPSGTNHHSPSSPRDLSRTVSLSTGAVFSVIDYLSFDWSPAHVAVRDSGNLRQEFLSGPLRRIDRAHASQYALCRIIC